MRYKAVFGIVVLLGVGWCAPASAAPGPKAILQAAQKVAAGKQALVNRDTTEAHRLFQQAARLHPQNGEARLYLAATRLLSWSLRHKALFSQLKLTGPAGDKLKAEHLDPLQFLAELPGAVVVPNSVARGDQARRLVAKKLLPDVLASLEDLNAVPEGFASSLPITNPFTGGAGVELDDADVALFEAVLQLTLAEGYLALVYDTDNIRFKDLLAETQARTFDIEEDVLAPYPAFLRLKAPEQAALAKQALIAAAERYLAAESLIEQETDDQDNDLVALSLLPSDVDAKTAFHQAVVNVKRSLESLSEPGWTFALDEVLDLGHFFDQPLDLRALENGTGVQEALLAHIHFQTERAIANFHQIPASYSELVDLGDYGGRAGHMVEVDLGDALAAEAFAESLHSAVSVLASYNADIDLVPLVQPALERRLDVEDHLLTGHPQLLRVQSLTQLLAAKLSAQRALQRLLESSTYLRLSDDANQQDDLAPYAGSLARREMRWRPQLEQLGDLEGLVDDDLEDPATNLHVDFNPLIDHPTDPRELLPPFDETRPLLEQLPDPTLDGVLPDTTLDDWLDL